MNRNSIVLWFACLFAFSTSCLTGLAGDLQSQTAASRPIGAFLPKTGTWSEYALFDTATGKRTVMRMSIVGVENDSYWYELVIKDGNVSKIVKMMITGDPNEPENIKRIIVQSGTEPPRELDPDAVIKVGRETAAMLQQETGIPVPDEVDLKVVNTGEGSVTVPAGTFEVSLYQVMDTTGKVYGEYKLSDQVHPFGIVTSESEGSTMVLVGYGSGAESLIVEEPARPKDPPLPDPGIIPRS